MFSPSHPWRVVLAALISLIGCSYLAYFDLYGMPAGGVRVEDQSGHAVVSYVENDSPGARSGLEVGDSIAAVDGQPVGGIIDWLAHRMNFKAKTPIHITVERSGRRLELTMTVYGGLWEGDSAQYRVSEIIFIASKLITLLIGLFVVFSRPRDFVSRLGGWVLVTMSVVFQAFPWGLSSALRSVSFILQWPAMIAYVSAAFRTPLLFAFFCLFPRKLIDDRRIWVALLAGPFIATIYALYLLARTVYQPEHLASLAPAWVLTALGVQSVIYLVAALLVLPVGYWKLESPTDRRKSRVLVFGALIGLLFYLPHVIGVVLATQNFPLSGFVSSSAIDLVSSVGFLVFPFSFAYAILRHRLFDVRVMIRRGLQYALARRVLLSVPLVLGALLVLDLMLHGNRPLFAVLKSRGWLYACIALVTGVAYLRRGSWLSALDRRFFRDKYDAQQVFHEIVEEIRRASTVQKVAPQVVSRINDVLHAEFCALLLRKQGESFYRIVSVSPTGAFTSDLPATNKMVTLVRALDTSAPISLAESGWLWQQLPQTDKDFLHNSRIDLLVPVAIAEGQSEAMLVMGAKLSEEPYSREDVGLLENVAAAIALLLVRGPAGLPGRAFEECPRCGTCYDTGTTNCEAEGATLRLVASPRLLVERYRLDKRLGQGGMGKVYQATDVSLDRTVAVKMIREEFSTDQDALERFRRESRAVGGFSHPNIVTVHDYGLDPNRNAFLVMEFLEGQTLREEISISKRLTPARTLPIFEAMCAGVGAAHDRGLVHRDLKPENVFLVHAGASEIVKITDFGIAKFLPRTAEDTGITLTDVFIGSLPYMSPEQLCGGELSPLWDVWALAVIAFETLCGSLPFRGSDFQTLRSAILEGVRRPVSSLVPEAPPQWQEFFERALASSAEDRPGSVTEFWASLQGCFSSASLDLRTEKSP
jgi:eukaryotic-like serine/threonine-protein kinase